MLDIEENIVFEAFNNKQRTFNNNNLNFGFKIKPKILKEKINFLHVR